MTNMHLVLMDEVYKETVRHSLTHVFPNLHVRLTLKNAIRSSSPCKGRVTMGTEAFKLQIGYKSSIKYHNSGSQDFIPNL